MTHLAKRIKPGILFAQLLQQLERPGVSSAIARALRLILATTSTREESRRFPRVTNQEASGNAIM